jgi:hypothetical protein
MSQFDPASSRLSHDHVLYRARPRSLAVGAICFAACAIGGLWSPDQFFRSYLFAYIFWFGIALGCLAILMIQHVTGGAWGAAIRRLLESGMRTLPLMAVLFLPILLGLPHLYQWARPEEVARDPLLQHKSLYLNVPFFVVRAVFYFAVWVTLASRLSRWSLEQDRSGDLVAGRRLELLSRGGLVLVGLTMSFAAVDWIMSLDPHWFSTIFGILVMGGQVVNALAFTIIVAALLADREPFAAVLSPARFHDLGSLLLAFIMLWAYFSFSQFLITWSGNLREEIPWYVERLHGGWQWIGLGLIVFHFALPFAILLSRGVKRRRWMLARIAALVVVARLVDVFWLVRPTFSPGHLAVHWLDPVAFAGLGGIWLGVFVRELATRPLIPQHDPYLSEAA